MTDEPTRPLPTAHEPVGHPAVDTSGSAGTSTQPVAAFGTGAGTAGASSGQPPAATPVGSSASDRPGGAASAGGGTIVGRAGRFGRELLIILVVALVASALLRAFVVQAFYVPTGSMLPEVQLHDRILVSRIGDIERGEVVVFEDPGGWIPPSEQSAPPGAVRKAFEWIGVLPSSGHEHLVKRVVGLPGDHVVCCVKGKLTINGAPVDESSFLFQKGRPADNIDFDVVVPADHIFVLGDHRYVSGDSSRHLTGQDAFVPTDVVTGRAFAVIWPAGNAHILHVPSAYDDVPAGRTPPAAGVVNQVRPGGR